MSNIFKQVIQTSKGRFALFLGIAALIVGGVAFYAFDGEYVPNGEVTVELPKTLAGQSITIGEPNLFIQDNNIVFVKNTKEAEKKEELGYVPGEIIVKFKDDPEDKISKTVGKEINIAAKGDISSFNANINLLNKRHRTQKIEPVFKSLRQAGKVIRSLDKINEIKTKFPLRANRASKEAIIPKLENIYKITLSKDVDIEQAVYEYSKDSSIEYAQPNYLIKTQMIPDDPYYSSANSWGQDYDDLWGLKKIEAEKAWDISQGEGIVVAVVDTGLDYNHEDIKDNVWINKKEIPNNDLDDDSNG